MSASRLTPGFTSPSSAGLFQISCVDEIVAAGGTAPKASFTWSPAVPQVGQIVTFTDTSTESPMMPMISPTEPRMGASMMWMSTVLPSRRCAVNSPSHTLPEATLCMMLAAMSFADLFMAAEYRFR